MQSSSEEAGPITNINVTPLVDVSLVLVIIFMAVAPFVMQAGIKAAETKAVASKGKTAAQENVNLELNAAGEIRINGKTVVWNDLPQALEQAILKSKDRLVFLSASPAVQVRQVVELLDLAKQRGAKKLAIMRPSQDNRGL